MSAVRRPSRSFTEHLSSRYDDPDFRAKFQKIVGGEVERVNLIVQQLLEFAKPVPPKLRPLNLAELTEETLAFLNQDLLKQGVEVTRNYATQAPVLADPQQMKQVLLNLLLNSLQAINGQGWLTLATATQGTEIVLTIQDNGAGIPPEALPHIFDPFFTTKPTGTGLGLAVSRSIIQEHGGRITVDSQVGRGTNLSIYLPVAASTSAS